MVIVLDLLARHFGFCYEFVFPPDRKVGSELPNGSWTGLLGMLQRGEADIGGTLFSVTWQRSAVVDFSVPLYLDEMNAFHVRPKVSSDMAGFIKPYTSQVWLMVFFVSLVVFVASVVVVKCNIALLALSSTQESSQRVMPFGPMVAGWLGSADKVSRWTWPVLLAQSVPWEPRENLMRWMAGLWLLVSFILGTVYRSNLKAMLIIPKVKLPFDNLGELVESGTTIVLIESSSVHVDIMRADNNTNLGKIKWQMQVYPYDELNIAMSNVYQGKAAGFAVKLGLVGVLNNEFSSDGMCITYIMSRGFLGPRSLSIAFPTGSSLREKVDPVLVKLKESGIIDKIISDAMFNATECLKPLTSTLAAPQLRHLELEDFYGVISLYVTGMVAGTATFLLELGLAAVKGRNYPNRPRASG